MNRAGRDDKNPADLDELIEETTVDAYGDDEKLWAFRQAFEANVTASGHGRHGKRTAINGEGARWT